MVSRRSNACIEKRPLKYFFLNKSFEHGHDIGLMRLKIQFKTEKMWVAVFIQRDESRECLNTRDVHEKRRQ